MDNAAPKCDKKDKDWNSDKTGLVGTCRPKSGDFSSVIFGNGKCRKGIVHDDTAYDTFNTYPLTSN